MEGLGVQPELGITSTLVEIHQNKVGPSRLGGLMMDNLLPEAILMQSLCSLHMHLYAGGVILNSGTRKLGLIKINDL